MVTFTDTIVPVQGFSNVSLDDSSHKRTSDQITPREKSLDSDCLSKPIMTAAPDNSLNALMVGRRTSFSAAQAARTNFMKQRFAQSKSVSFDSGIDYGYGEPEPHSGEEQPPMKRRKYMRRNSKTPAMLMAMAMQSPILDSIKLEIEREDAIAENETSSRSGDEEIDAGLEVAEELVRTLMARRLSPSARTA